MPVHSDTSRRAFLSAIAGAPALLAAGRRKPNVLFILTDDQRQDTIHALGNPNIHTPNLDTLVRSGVTFENAYCMGGYSGAVCLPSRMMIHRGRSWFTVRNQAEGYPNFARSMGTAGYVTYHLGKKGNEDTQSHRSFDYNFYMEPNDVAEREGGRPGKQMADRAIEFLEKWKKDPATGKGKPFFLCLSGPAPHDPRVAPPEYMAKYDPEKLPLPPNFKPFHPFDNGDMFVRDEQLAPWPRTATEIRRHLRDYYGVITYMDEQIGRILAGLKAIGEYDNTIIVFTSDQGIAIGSHGLMGKQNLYEHSMRSGMIVCGPGIPKGKRVAAFAYLFDIYPTVCDLVGSKAPDSLEGKSLAPILHGKGKAVRDTVFLAYRDLQRAVRKGPWKLIRYPQINKTQLFDLASDPYELKDLSNNPAHKAKVEELMAALREQQRLFGDTAALSSENPKPAEVSVEFFRNPPAVAKPAQKKAK